MPFYSKFSIQRPPDIAAGATDGYLCQIGEPCCRLPLRSSALLGSYLNEANSIECDHGCITLSLGLEAFTNTGHFCLLFYVQHYI